MDHSNRQLKKYKKEPTEMGYLNGIKKRYKSK